MAASISSGALQHQNPTFQSTAVFNILDPISLILSQNSSDSFEPIPLKLTTETYFMERGPRYTAYAHLRESKLPTAFSRFPVSETESWRQTTPPPKKQVKFKHQRASGYGASSMLAQSVPDFSATLRKENRKPKPAPSGSKMQGVLSSRGSKSVGSGEKRRGMGNGGGGGGLMARKSYANLEELKGLSAAASNSIMNGENRGNVGGRGIGNGKAVLGYRH
ncbi:unnamed protein product [Linum tenue]|uniref:Uncharacterized protein n=1 Tax=Linum tenue TaxID=586396 RepID=A0AAV0MXU7_9ROSI|nr:unnamed protein product [Linum tenue]